MQSSESGLKSIIRYSGIVFGAGFILLSVGALALLAELLARAGGALASVPQLIAALVILMVGLVFGIIFGSSVVRSSDLRRPDTVKKVSLSTTAFSMLILFSAIALIVLLVSVYSSVSFSFFPAGVFAQVICMMVGAILLLSAYRIFAANLNTPKLAPGILSIAAVVLIYIVPAAASQGLLGDYLGSSGASGLGLQYATSLGLTGEFYMTTAAFIIVAVCALLYVSPQLRTVKGLHALRIILSSAAILFGIALMYSNFMGVSAMAPYIGQAVQVVYSMSVIFTAIVVLGVAGIIILVAGIMSIVVSSKALAAHAQPYPRPQAYPAPEVPPPPVYAAPTQKICPVCGAQNAVAAAYCSNCGTKL